MTDLHTHILPAMDDGAKSVEMSLEMLRMERDQGVDTVVLRLTSTGIGSGRSIFGPGAALRRRACGTH